MNENVSGKDLMMTGRKKAMFLFADMLLKSGILLCDKEYLKTGLIMRIDVEDVWTHVYMAVNEPLPESIMSRLNVLIYPGSVEYKEKGGVFLMKVRYPTELLEDFDETGTGK